MNTEKNLVEEIKITKELLKQLADDAWVSYRGNYSFYNCFVNSKFDRLEYIENHIITLSPEDYEKALNEVINMHNLLKDYKGKNLKNKILEDTNKQNDEESLNFSDEEISNLLNTLEDNKLETVYPTQDFDEEFIPLDLPDIPSDNPIQPGDIEKNINLPR